ncbi:MAG TPA: hypothetical protein VFU19_11990 [Iamia sp.]|nr:hypothetical protein [Iamia sp.]
MTYADVVMWMWVVALVGTLVAFGLAWRGLTRADLAVVGLRDELDGLDAVTGARADLEAATRSAAGERVRLHTRVAER